MFDCRDYRLLILRNLGTATFFYNDLAEFMPIRQKKKKEKRNCKNQRKKYLLCVVIEMYLYFQ